MCPAYEATCEGASQRRPVARTSGAHGVDPVARPGQLHPVALVWIVAGAEVDQLDPVAVDHLLEQRGAERGPGRERFRLLEVAELVDVGDAVLDRPELRRDRAAIGA